MQGFKASRGFRGGPWNQIQQIACLWEPQDYPRQQIHFDDSQQICTSLLGMGLGKKAKGKLWKFGLEALGGPYTLRSPGTA